MRSCVMGGLPVRRRADDEWGGDSIVMKGSTRGWSSRCMGGNGGRVSQFFFAQEFDESSTEQVGAVRRLSIVHCRLARFRMIPGFSDVSGGSAGCSC